MLAGLQSSGIVLADDLTGHEVTVGDIRSRAPELAAHPGLAFLVAGQSLAAWADCLALLEAGQPIGLIDPATTDDALADLVGRYRPARVIDHEVRQEPRIELAGGEYVRPGEWRPHKPAAPVHPDLAVMMTTSGTTGSPRFVRLSRKNVLVNARQIASALSLTETDRGMSTMPLCYSFGFSVLTSHVVSGGSVLVTRASVIDATFWDRVDTGLVTTLAGVPTTFKMLRRLGFADRETPSLDRLIQAGGRLDPDLVGYFGDSMTARGGQFFVMYGQTEASPRMTILPDHALRTKPGSVGLPLGGASIAIVDADGSPAADGAAGRVVYEGPNVMMGYAESRDDLVLGDVTGARLETGDEGYLDEDGYLFLTGRTKRICKLSGVRVSLDDVETMVADVAPAGVEVAAVSSRDDSVTLAVVGLSEDGTAQVRRSIARRLRVPANFVDLRVVKTLPLMSSGKVDYRNLMDSAS